MKIVIKDDATISGNIEQDLRSGALIAYSKDDHYIPPTKAITDILASHCAVSGVCTDSSELAASIFNSIRKFRGEPLKRAANDSKPEQQSTYDTYKDSLANKWKETTNAPQRVENGSSYEKHKAKLANAWRK